MEDSTSAPPTTQNFRFLDLPPELRNRISEAYFAPDPRGRAATPALTQVNRQIRSETTAMAYHGTHFVNTSVALTPSLPPVLSKLPHHIAPLLQSGLVDVIYLSLKEGTHRPDLRMQLEWNVGGNVGMTCEVLVWNATPLATAILKYRAWKRVEMYQAFLRDRFPDRSGPVQGVGSFTLITELRPLRQIANGAVFMDGSYWAPRRIIRGTPSQDKDWERVVGCVLGEAVDAMLYVKPYTQPVYRHIAGFCDRIEQLWEELIQAAAHWMGIPVLTIRIMLHIGGILFLLCDLIGFRRVYAGLVAAMRWILWLRAFL